MLEDVEVDLGLESVEALGDALLDASFCVRQISLDPVGLPDDADDPSVSLHLLLGDRMEVEQRSARDEELMDVA